MRVLSTKRGEGCVQVGRLLDGKLGALGQDSAFHNDGLFHEFAVNTFGAQRSCTLLDGNDRLFLNATVGDIPASAWRGNFPDKGCVPSTAGPYERFAEDGKRKPYPVCPQADERNLYYGLLGPGAKSITYIFDGQTHTQSNNRPRGRLPARHEGLPHAAVQFQRRWHPGRRTGRRPDHRTALPRRRHVPPDQQEPGSAGSMRVPQR